MPTVDTEVVRQIIKANGDVPGYRRCSAVYEYRMGDWKRRLFVTEGGEEEQAFNKSPYVKDLRLIWSRKGGVVAPEF